MAQPIVKPELPFVGEVPSGLQPGKMLRFQGVTHPNSDRFNINLATGPNSKPRDDTALHMSVRLNQGYIARNTYKDGSWGDEQGNGRLPIGQAQSFEIIILVDPHHYKIAVNGQHFCEFPHRLPYQEVSHLLIDGDVSITLISFEGIPLPGSESSSQASQVNAQGPQYGGPPPPNYGPGGYGPGGYAPPPPPGAEPESQFGGFLEQAQDILAGAIKSGAAEKLLGSILHSGGQSQPQQPQGYAHQNARYGIYPDLPNQDSSGAGDSAASNLIAGSGGTVTSGGGPSVTASGGGQSSSGPLEGLLMGLLNGSNQQQTQQPQHASGQSSDLLSGLLSSLVSPPSNQGGHQPNQAPQAARQGNDDIFSNILQSLVSGQQQPSTTQNPSAPQQSDVLSGILSSLVSPSPANQGQPSNNQTPNPPNQNPAPNPSNDNQNSEMLANLLQGLLAKAREQQDSTRPIEETSGGTAPPQQYGQYPHPPQQEQRGPMESLLSGLLSGGGGGAQQPQQQQHQGPQIGGDGSVGGLGSMGGILGSLAGSFLHRNDHNQGH